MGLAAVLDAGKGSVDPWVRPRAARLVKQQPPNV